MDKSLTEARVDAIKGVLLTLVLGTALELLSAVISLMAATIMVFCHAGIDYFIYGGLTSLEHYKTVMYRDFIYWMVVGTFFTLGWILKHLYQEVITYSYQRDIALGLREHPLAGTKDPLKRKR